MHCDFCGCDLPVDMASNDTDALVQAIHNAEPEDRDSFVLDMDDKCVYRFWPTHLGYPVEGFRHFCKECASKLDDFGNRLLEADCMRRVLCARSSSANAINRRMGSDIHPYMVAFDISLKDHPVAQVVRKDGDRWTLTNMIRGDAVGHLLKYMEGPIDA